MLLEGRRVTECEASIELEGVTRGTAGVLVMFYFSRQVLNQFVKNHQTHIHSFFVCTSI